VNRPGFSGELTAESRQRCGRLLTTIVRLLVLERWSISERLQQAMVIEPADALQRRELDVL